MPDAARLALWLTALAAVGFGLAAWLLSGPPSTEPPRSPSGAGATPGTRRVPASRDGTEPSPVAAPYGGSRPPREARARGEEEAPDPAPVPAPPPSVTRVNDVVSPGRLRRGLTPGVPDEARQRSLARQSEALPQRTRPRARASLRLPPAAAPGPLELPLELELPVGARPVLVQGLTTWTAAGVDVTVVPSSPFGGLQVTRPGPGAVQWEVRTNDSLDAGASEVIRLRLDLPPGGNLPRLETRLLQVRYRARGGQPVDLVDLIVEPVARGE